MKVACVALVLVAVVATHCVSASNLRMLLTEEEVPATLSYTDCLALPVDDSGGSLGANNCGSNLLWWPIWPCDADGYCVAGDVTRFTFSVANAKRAGYTPTSSLINMRNNAERCIITLLVNKYSNNDATYWTAINDVAEEGTYVDGDGSPVASEYLNWAAGEPTGAGEDCVVYTNNEAYDVDCGSGRVGRVVCTKEAQASSP